MRYLFQFLLISGVCLGAISAQADPGLITVPPNSFLTQHVDTVSQLSRQIASDPVVRLRFAKHFHLSSPAVQRYLQKNLVLKTLPTEAHISVYCLSPDGHEYVINTIFPVGTHVFASRMTGKPVLKFASGNPLVASLPGLPGNSTQVLPKPIPIVRLAQLIKPAIKTASPKTPAIKAKEEPLFVTMSGGPGLYIMPQQTKPAGGEMRK
jgi:hypothetical protein